MKIKRVKPSLKGNQMEKFIVWDREEKRFLFECEVERLTIRDLRVSNQLKDIARFVFCESIGKQDINGQEIYADCSIVELIYSNETKYSYFKYESRSLSYEMYQLRKNPAIVGLKSFGKLFADEFALDPFKIKIIDTIQQNKLGLIK